MKEVQHKARAPVNERAVDAPLERGRGESPGLPLKSPWEELRGRRWRLDEALGGASYDRSGDDLCGPGIFVDLEPWAWHARGSGRAA